MACAIILPLLMQLFQNSTQIHVIYLYKYIQLARVSDKTCRYTNFIFFTTLHPKMQLKGPGYA